MSKQKSYYQWIRSEMANFLPANYGNVLEVGCGAGSFFKNIDRPCEYWGIEPSQEAAKIASETLHKVAIGKYEDVRSQFPNNYFDVVICNDVIEHMENEDFFLKTIVEKMKDSSYLVGSIPNVRYFDNLYKLLIKKDWQYRDSGIVDRTHLRFFTEISFKRKMEEHNFKIEEFGGINNLMEKKINNLRDRKIRILIRLLELDLFGSHQDIKFLQFGFRAKFERNKL